MLIVTKRVNLSHIMLRKTGKGVGFNMDYVMIENEFANIVEDVSKAAGWTVDRKIVLAIASTFVASGKTLMQRSIKCFTRDEEAIYMDVSFTNNSWI